MAGHDRCLRGARPQDADSGSAEAFRGWLTRTLPGEGKRFEIDDYAYLPMRNFLGLYTCRFLRLATLRPVWRREVPRLRSMADVERFHAEHNLVDRYVRTERLEDDLAAVLRETGLDGIAGDDLAERHRNASSHRSIAHYYDEKTIALVAREERFLIDRFGYEPPEPAIPGRG